MLFELHNATTEFLHTPLAERIVILVRDNKRYGSQRTTLDDNASALLSAFGVGTDQLLPVGKTAVRYMTAGPTSVKGQANPPLLPGGNSRRDLVSTHRERCSSVISFRQKVKHLRMLSSEGLKNERFLPRPPRSHENRTSAATSLLLAVKNSATFAAHRHNVKADR